MRILCLIDSQLHPGDRWLWNYLPDAADEVDFLVTKSDRSFSSSRLGALRRYAHYYRTGRSAAQLASRDQYDLIVAWENKNGLPLLLARWLGHKRQPPAVLLTFAVKPGLSRYRWAIRPWLGNNVYFTAPSAWEAALGKAAFGLSDRQMRVCYLGSYDVRGSGDAADPAPADLEGSLFSGGLTGRDYASLWSALHDLPVRCVVNAPAALTRHLPDEPNIERHELLPSDQYFRQLLSARAVVLPLLAHEYAAGLSVVLNAMAAGRPIICTATPVLSEYLTHGVTALLVPPQQPEQLRAAIKWVIENREAAESIGQAARRCYLERFTFEQFAARVHHYLQDVCARA